MNKTLTSREAILSVCKEVVIQSGIQALNIRGIAEKCGVSVGSVYNYFPSKGDLMIATVESVWKEIMHGSKGCISNHSFVENVSSLYNSIQDGCEKYPAFFSIHSMSIASLDKDKGRDVMNRYFVHIESALLKALDFDENVREDVFSDNFTKEAFVDFIFSNIITLLMKKDKSCDFLLELIKRTIY